MQVAYIATIKGWNRVSGRLNRLDLSDPIQRITLSEVHTHAVFEQLLYQECASHYETKLVSAEL